MRKYVRLLGNSLFRKNSNVLLESAKTYRTFAEQQYCEGQPLIPKQEQDQVLAIPGLRSYSAAETQAERPEFLPSMRHDSFPVQ
jgi:hypothetical protein